MGEYYFRGFSSPNYTQVPDEVFDELLAELTDPELRVLLYIIRRTFGFKKNSDDISLKQLVEGITTRGGRMLDRGAGVSKTSATRAVKGLVEKGVITAHRNSSPDKGDRPTTYSLRMSAPVSNSETRGGINLGHGRVPNLDTHETVKQEIVPTRGGSKFRRVILPYIEDVARELGDEAPLGSSVTRASKILTDLQEEHAIELILDARTITKERSSRITKTRGESTSIFTAKNKMPYFFSVLESLIGEGK